MPCTNGWGLGLRYSAIYNPNTIKFIYIEYQLIPNMLSLIKFTMLRQVGIHEVFPANSYVGYEDVEREKADLHLRKASFFSA
jgi:hypothetical protein